MSSQRCPRPCCARCTLAKWGHDWFLRLDRMCRAFLLGTIEPNRKELTGPPGCACHEFQWIATAPHLTAVRLPAHLAFLSVKPTHRCGYDAGGDWPKVCVGHPGVSTPRPNGLQACPPGQTWPIITALVLLHLHSLKINILCLSVPKLHASAATISSSIR